jgi:quinone-modifying oxidoreductase, subunit QmoA
MSDTAGNGAVLVVGGGISGLTAALEAAEVGNDVFLIEKNPYFGGRVAQLNQYFPKLCPPTCGLEINFKRIKDNRKIRTYTLTTVKSISGGPGNYEVNWKQRPATSTPTALPAVIAPRPVTMRLIMPSTSA